MVGSRGVRRGGTAAFIAILVAGLVAGCTTTGSWASPSGSVGPAGSGGFMKKFNTAEPSARKSQAPEKTGAVAVVTKPPVTVDQITVTYEYASELITPLAHLYGSRMPNFAVIKVKNGNASSAKVVVTTEIVGFTNKAINTVDIPAGQTKEIKQNPRLDPSSIDKLNTQRPADFHIRVVYLDQGQEREALDETQQTLVFGRRDFPWVIQGLTQQEVFELVAAIVMPQDPAVEKLIRDAAEYIPGKAMTGGYGGIEGDEKGTVLARLEAIWQAETKDYNLTYISTLMTFAPGETQRVRLPMEVLEQHSGNCIELAVLYASVAEALGMQPVLIMIPGHAFMGVRVDASSDIYYFIETTAIGQTDFITAVKAAGQEFAEARDHIAAGDEDYGWVDITTARSKNILPIPWR